MKSIVAATHYRRRRLYEKQLLIVDGYNMIGAWPELVQLKKQERLEDARELLLSRLSNYAKYEGLEIIVVFDAQLVRYSANVQKVPFDRGFHQRR